MIGLKSDDKIDHQDIVWFVSFGVMIIAFLHQLVNWVMRNFFMSDEDYTREYFEELELKQRLDLRPVLDSDAVGGHDHTKQASSLLQTNPLSSLNQNQLSSHHSSSSKRGGGAGHPSQRAGSSII